MNSIWDDINTNVFLQDTIEGYNKLVRQRYREIIRDLQIKSMLEVGFGPGVDYLGAVHSIPDIKYTGVDVTDQMVEHCRKRYPKGTFLKADIYQLPFQKEFELVYCKDVLNHLDRWKAAYEELLRVSEKYVLLNFFSGLGSTTFKACYQRNGHIDNFYDWNEVMTTLYSHNPYSITVYPLQCKPNGEETLVLIKK